MKKALPLLIIGLVFTGCFNLRRSIRPGRSGLELIYLTDLPESAQGWTDLQATLKESKQDPLLVVDDPRFSTLDDLAWWEGEREISLLRALGCDLFLPPAEWMLLGPERLADLSTRVEFFIVALDVVDEKDNYLLSRYMIRQRSPYRLAFSAAASRDTGERVFEGIDRLPLDSILPITASFLGLQTDFFIFFDDADSLPEVSGRVHVVPREGENRVMDFRFISRVEFKLKEHRFTFDLSGNAGNDPLALWQAHADSLDARVLGTCKESLSIESLEILANKSLKRLAEDRFSVDGIGILIPEGFIAGEIPAGRITFGKMREVMAPEIFFLVSIKDLPDNIASRSRDFSAEGEIQRALLPSSLCLADDRFQGKSLKLTGITSARIAKQMFASDVEVEDK
ncbi:hypothetical protein CEE36_11045 [candidate division TA06 bacterium B3_TA06]|uniref:Uncharacterized protein n=1 Tax=candidate division TA06 bacterium B3_TA06 TaxID=2012487 RepID=A0A532URX1_UNCT6|nr:MAG: hypothetical protein CEE36_11045 [candidate division TA06 bacterium B3_TA06]